MIGWPSALAAPSAAARAMRSLAPPAANGTTRWIGLVGQVWANALPAAKTATAPTTSEARRMSFMVSPVVRMCWSPGRAGNGHDAICTRRATALACARYRQHGLSGRLLLPLHPTTGGDRGDRRAAGEVHERDRDEQPVLHHPEAVDGRGDVRQHP